MLAPFYLELYEALKGLRSDNSSALKQLVRLYRAPHIFNASEVLRRIIYQHTNFPCLVEVVGPDKEPNLYDLAQKKIQQLLGQPLSSNPLV